jgi:Leu/Phe-tRNA-protein transferase
MKANKKFYAVRVFIQRKKVGGRIRGGKSFRGISKAINKEEASKQVVDMLMEALKDETFIPVERKDIVIKECVAYNDFAV